MSANLAVACCACGGILDPFPSWPVQFGAGTVAPNTHWDGPDKVHEDTMVLRDAYNPLQSAQCICSGATINTLDYVARTASGVAWIDPHYSVWDCDTAGYNPYYLPDLILETWDCEYFEHYNDWSSSRTPRPSGPSFTLATTVPIVDGYPSHIVTLEANINWAGGAEQCGSPYPSDYNRLDPTYCFHPYIPPNEQNIGWPDNPYAGIRLSSNAAGYIYEMGVGWSPYHHQLHCQQYYFPDDRWNYGTPVPMPTYGEGSSTIRDTNLLPNGSWNNQLAVTIQLFNLLGDFVITRGNSHLTVNLSWMVYATPYTPP